MARSPGEPLVWQSIIALPYTYLAPLLYVEPFSTVCHKWCLTCLQQSLHVQDGGVVRHLCRLRRPALWCAHALPSCMSLRSAGKQVFGTDTTTMPACPASLVHDCGRSMKSFGLLQGMMWASQAGSHPWITFCSYFSQRWPARRRAALQISGARTTMPACRCLPHLSSSLPALLGLQPHPSPGRE